MFDMMTRVLCLATLIAALACAGPANPTADLLGAGGGTGLVGQVLRGPITPVCRVDVPCDAPFSAWFEVLQGTALVTRFHSDSARAFKVALPPGAYVGGPWVWRRGSKRGRRWKPVSATAPRNASSAGRTSSRSRPGNKIANSSPP